ncbi:MAG: cytochrome c-type biogenesis protein CcmH [Acidimicrobiia bacterium]
MSGRRRWLPWLALAAVVAAALWVGAGAGDGPPTPAARADRLAAQVRCPTCEGLSAAESETPAAVAVRQANRRRVDAGQTDDEIRAFLVSRYDRGILLTPGGTGVAALVWALPVAAVVLGAGGMALALRRRREAGLLAATAEDRRLVDRARQAGAGR